MNRNGNDVKQVMVSESSRRDARGLSSRSEVAKAIDELEEERSSLNSCKLKVQTKLAFIKNSIRGRQLPQSDYLRLIKEQDELVGESLRLDNALSEANIRLGRLRYDMSQFDKEDGQAETNALLRKILIELEILNGRQRAT